MVSFTLLVSIIISLYLPFYFLTSLAWKQGWLSSRIYYKENLNFVFLVIFHVENSLVGSAGGLTLL